MYQTHQNRSWHSRFDSDWNPQPDLQAIARVYQILGQTRTVPVCRLISRGTIEERMVELEEKKLYMGQMINGTPSISEAHQELLAITLTKWK